ncbi:MAG: hypothetical protein ACRDXF_10540 [Acidimicrobiia bacterium]
MSYDEKRGGHRNPGYTIPYQHVLPIANPPIDTMNPSQVLAAARGIALPVDRRQM